MCEGLYGAADVTGDVTDTNELLSNANLHSREVLNALTLNILRRPPFLLPLTQTQHTPQRKFLLVLRCYFRKALPRPTNHTTPRPDPMPTHTLRALNYHQIHTSPTNAPDP